VTAPQTYDPGARAALVAELKSSSPHEAALRIGVEPPARAVDVLSEMNPSMVQDILEALDLEARARISMAAPREVAEQWARNAAYPEGSIGRLMDPALAVFRPEATVGDAIDTLKSLIRTSLITYGSSPCATCSSTIARRSSPKSC
jgi:magnesium transporter